MNKLLLGDCREVLKNFNSNTFDMIFTDPPYKLVNGGRKSKRNFFSDSLIKNYHGKNGIIYDVPKISTWITELYRVLKPDNYFFTMCNDRNLENFLHESRVAGFKLCEILILKKQNKVPSCYFFKNYEFIIMFRKGKYKEVKNKGIGTIFETNLIKNKIHLSQKNTDYIKQIIKCCSKVNDLILDPFMGSGSTCLACVNTSRNYIGIENNKKSYDLALNRIAIGVE